MSFKYRACIWALVAYLIPLGIFIYDRAWNRDAIWWAVGVTLLAVIVEFINWRQTRKL